MHALRIDAPRSSESISYAMADCMSVFRTMVRTGDDEANAEIKKLLDKIFVKKLSTLAEVKAHLGEDPVISDLVWIEKKG